ncbi:hypothetical protein BGL_1c35240 [Burkholderia plantarii]|uniref:Uncharacterized protein n=2 Tax=Burkholderia plantarii TaxID=41899 RepID=A0A0B6RX89_BURPL|nr:hypothetical protein [Burkholderia plantarii]AJK47998.1 hypothetical protein BGL_1c35240 [Burkholderia plantarii]
MIELSPPSRPAARRPRAAAGATPRAVPAARTTATTTARTIPGSLGRPLLAMFRQPAAREARAARLRRLARGAALAATLAGATLAARAQGAPQSIDWEVRVVHAGQTVDTFHQTTTVGQSRTDSHTYVVRLPAGCPASVEASAVAAMKPERTRSVTVAPLYVDGSTVTLALDVQETVDDGDGCSLSPRQISASHPGLAVRADGWTDWAPADKTARLVYQVRAHVVAN